MGIIRAVAGAIGGGLADQWLEVIAPDNMSDTTVMTSGVPARKDDRRSSNRKGTEGYITDGSVIQVGVNECMLLVDGGKIVDYSAEAGYYRVKNDATPSLFNGDLLAAVKETFSRVKYGGVPSVTQRAFFINLQEIKNIAFGTTNPVNYFDNFYNAELYLRAHGYFSIRIVDPLKFYAEAIPRNAARVDINDIHKLYLAEFLTALQTAIGKMSVDGMRISHIPSKSQELSQYMATVLDDEWTERRGMIIESVGIASVSYDEESKKLINIRNQGAMLQDPGVREGYVQGSVARGMEAAGSNSGGAMGGFVGLGLGMQAGGSFMGAASASNQQQMQRQGPAAPVAPTPPVSGGWACACGARNEGNFCFACGAKKQEAPAADAVAFCPQCGTKMLEGAFFCAHCGKKIG